MQAKAKLSDATENKVFCMSSGPAKTEGFRGLKELRSLQVPSSNTRRNFVPSVQTTKNLLFFDVLQTTDFPSETRGFCGIQESSALRELVVVYKEDVIFYSCEKGIKF